MPILEDDPYSDLRYEGEALPSLKALDPYGYVIHLSSFSKVLFPGLRLGWIAAPRPLVRQLALVKQTVDLHSGTLGQWIVERFLSGGLFARHLGDDARGLPAAPRRPPRGPRGGGARRASPGTGPRGASTSGAASRTTSAPPRLLAQAAAERVAYLPGGASFVEEPPGEHIRLNFTFAPEEQLREGVRRLGAGPPRRAGGAAPGKPRGGGTPPIV